MTSCALNDFNARRGGQEPPDAMHYPVYTFVICQHLQVKAVNDVCSTIFNRKGKNYGYFRQIRLISSSILPALNQTQG